MIFDVLPARYTLRLSEWPAPYGRCFAPRSAPRPTGALLTLRALRASPSTTAPRSAPYGRPPRDSSRRAPQPWHPVAKVYIANSIDRYFGFYGPGGGPAGAKAGDKKPWNFSYHDSHIYRALQRGPTAGQVVDRTKLAPMKLPSQLHLRVSE